MYLIVKMTNGSNITLSVFGILGGVSLFLFGIRGITKSLEDLAGASLKLVITWLTKNRLRGFVIGLFISLSLQSSGAVMLMLIGFANAGLLEIGEAVSVILGAGVGSTLTVQILAFRIHQWAPAMLVVGFVFKKVFTGGRLKDVGSAIFSFGLVFLGMHLITVGASPLVKQEFLPAAIGFFSQTMIFAAVLAALLTVLFQSSAATLGLLIIMAFNGLIDMTTALPFIVGANIGSCGIAFIGSARGKPDGVRVAWTELIIRLVMGIVFILAGDYFVIAAEFITSDVARGIAHLHTMYALGATLIFIPLSGLVPRLVKFLVPEPRGESIFGPIYLDPNALSNPPVALGGAAREVLRQGDIVYSMLDDYLTAFSKYDSKLLEDIVKRDDRVDLLQERITLYLTRLTEEELSARESRTEMQLLTFTLELEHIADVISKDLSRHVQKRLDSIYHFSEEGFEEIIEFHGRVKRLLRKGLNTIALRDKSMAKEIIEETKEIVSLQRVLNRSHIERLHAGVKETSITSAIHIDMLADLARIAINISHIGYAILGKL